MVVKVSGKIDGKEVIFERAEGDRWNVTVPYDLDGMYVGELTAENDAGNIAYCTKILLIVDPATLCVRQANTEQRISTLIKASVESLKRYLCGCW